MTIWTRITSWMGGGISVVVYGAIIALFVIGMFSCIWPVSTNRKRLQRAVAILKQGDKAKRSWQEDRFLGRGSLMPHWSEYLNNLFFADGEYHNPANVEDYINEETVIDGPGRSKLSEALPGVQVSLGFLGTLLGLSLALSEMNSVDASTITSSMNTLLSSMKYAFLTSIFGVVASISFTLITRAVHSKAQNVLIEFYNALAKYAGVLSVDPMTQVAIYQQEQTGLLKQLCQTLTPENIRQVFEPVTKAVDLSCENQQKLMNEVAEAYIDKLNSAMNGQLAALSQTIQDTCRYQEKTIRTVSEALVDFAQTAKTMREAQQESYQLLNNFDRLITRSEGALTDVSNAQQQNTAVLNAQTECIDALNDLSARIQAQIQRMESAVGDLTENAEALNASSALALKEAGGALKNAAQEISQTMNKARGELSRDMSESLDYFEACMTEIIKRVESAALSVEQAAGGLPSSGAGGGVRS